MRKCLETTQRTINASIAAASQPQTSISAAPGVLMTPRSNGSATSQDFTAAMQLNSLANGGSGSNQVSISGLPALHSDGNLQYSTDRQLFHAADSDGSNLTLMPDLGFRCDIVPPSSMDYSFDEDMFLEDSLLFQFAYNHSGLTIPSTPTTRHQYLQNLPPDLTPIQTALSDSESPARADRSVHDALQITVGDLQGFHGNMDKIDSAGDLTYFRRPTLSRTLRCLIAYFQHFDLHTPIVHFASFKISEAHPALVLIMIAIGAVHLSESAFADSAYEACCILILQHDKASIRQPKEAFQLWYVQASVLAAQYGACTGDTDLFYRAQQHLSAVQTAIYKGLPEIHAAKRDSSNDWASWIYLETSSRLISWMFVVSSMFLALDPYSTAILPPMSCSMPAPSDESVWHAVSEIEWKIAQRAQPTPEADLWTIAKSVMLGEMPPESCGRISANSLLALIGAILATISTQQRLTMDIFDPYRGNTQRMERAISVWERLWRLHPRTERNMTRLDDPLLNDCLSLLGSAYYHLHLGEELFVLKKIAENPTLDLAFPPCNDRARCHKVIKFAANSWLVRAKLGITYLNKTGGLELGSQAITTAYESGKSEPTVI